MSKYVEFLVDAGLSNEEVAERLAGEFTATSKVYNYHEVWQMADNYRFLLVSILGE